MTTNASENVGEGEHTFTVGWNAHERSHPASQWGELVKN